MASAISAKGLAVKAGRNVLIQPMHLNFSVGEFVGVPAVSDAEGGAGNLADPQELFAQFLLRDLIVIAVAHLMDLEDTGLCPGFFGHDTVIGFRVGLDVTAERGSAAGTSARCGWRCGFLWCRRFLRRQDPG